MTERTRPVEESRGRTSRRSSSQVNRRSMVSSRYGECLLRNAAGEHDRLSTIAAFSEISSPQCAATTTPANYPVKLMETSEGG